MKGGSRRTSASRLPGDSTRWAINVVKRDRGVGHWLPDTDGNRVMNETKDHRTGAFRHQAGSRSPLGYERASVGAGFNVPRGTSGQAAY
jgi:hypothetical protein